jgi:DNA polymerase III epsilon subunit-like protein
VRYHLHDKQKVWAMYGKGFKQTQIARETGIPRTTIRDWIRYIENEKLNPRKPKILLYDIETSLIELYAWRTGQQYVGADQIRHDWYIHCCAFKLLGEKQIDVVSQIDDLKRFEKNHRDDYLVVEEMHKRFTEADVIVAHNGNIFDWKKFSARMLLHGLPPLRKPLMIDTLKLARQFGFTSKRLKDLAIAFKQDLKADSQYGWWKRAAEGDIEAHRLLKEYCAHDIPPMEGLLKILAPHVPNLLPNMNLLMNTDGMNCPCCGSENVRRDGEKIKGKTSVVAHYQCNTCGAWFDDGKNMRKGIVFRA